VGDVKSDAKIFPATRQPVPCFREVLRENCTRNKIPGTTLRLPGCQIFRKRKHFQIQNSFTCVNAFFGKSFVRKLQKKIPEIVDNVPGSGRPKYSFPSFSLDRNPEKSPYYIVQIRASTGTCHGWATRPDHLTRHGCLACYGSDDTQHREPGIRVHPEIANFTSAFDERRYFGQSLKKGRISFFTCWSPFFERSSI